MFSNFYVLNDCFQKSVVTFGTKNVVLGIQPPKVKKKRHVSRNLVPVFVFLVLN